MLFKRFLIWSYGSPPVQWSRTIYAILEKGIIGNSHNNLMKSIFEILKRLILSTIKCKPVAGSHFGGHLGYHSRYKSNIRTWAIV